MKQGSGQCANVTFHGTIPPSYEEHKMGGLVARDSSTQPTQNFDLR